MDVGGSVQTDPGVAVVVVVVVDELADENPGRLQGGEPFRERRRVLQRLVPRFGMNRPGVSGDSEL